MTNPTADNTITPLPSNVKITNADGSPTLFFQRWAQERSIDISNGISMADLVAFLTVEPDPSGTYTAADITVDEYGRVIEASDGSAGASLTVTDGTTSVADVASLTFTGAAVTTTGAGDAVVTITGGGGGGGSSGFSGAQIYLSANAPVNNQIIPWDTVEFDTGGFFSAAHNGFIVPAGVTKVRVDACIILTSNPPVTQLYFSVNGVQWATSGGAQAFGTITLSDVIPVSAGDVIQVFTLVNATINSQSTFSHFTIQDLNAGGGGGSAPTIVNADYFRINSGTVVNTANVPAPGNIQVIVQTAAGGTLGNNVAPPGFQNLFINTSGNVGNNPGQQYQGGSVFFRTADTSTTTAINFQASDWRNIAVFELENCTGVDAFFDYCNTNGNDFIIPVLRHSKGDLTFLMFEQDSGGTITFDALTGVTQLHQFIPSGTDNHAAAIAQLGSTAPSAVTGSNPGGFAYPCFLRVSAWNA